MNIQNLEIHVRILFAEPDDFVAEIQMGYGLSKTQNNHLSTPREPMVTVVVPLSEVRPSNHPSTLAGALGEVITSKVEAFVELFRHS